MFSKPSYFQCPSPSHQLPPSSFTTSKNLLFGLPLFLFPGDCISIIFLPTYSWSLLMTCPYHLSLPSLIFIPKRSTLTVLQMYLFLILSFLVTPIANLNIIISATSISWIVNLCNFHLFHLFLCNRHRLNSIHQWRAVTSETSHAIGKPKSGHKIGIFKTNFRPRFKVLRPNQFSFV